MERYFKARGSLFIKVLRTLGHEVVTANSGEDAIIAYKQNSLHFDYVIMDLTIPGGMGGKEAANHILSSLLRTGWKTTNKPPPDLNLNNWPFLRIFSENCSVP